MRANGYVEAAKITASNWNSRWLKKILGLAGINTGTYSGYSTGHAAVSAAYRSGTNIETIRATVGWSERSNHKHSSSSLLAGKAHFHGAQYHVGSSGHHQRSQSLRSAVGGSAGGGDMW
ncbi:unnamed protein product [Acanthoscelides obtectus]|uniref:Uncharacterized protein n=1 Tax=Acanthoscelides obtectus TaxID=200917 RepID=A0A9P0M8L2_ACAOB|nr:unnamed protein product [Acanthoscelides obtectus]CAK1664399.1 hypothetical protein AOBTE_LOCUS24241 [Acanthoscelides obtectus]